MPDDVPATAETAEGLDPPALVSLPEPAEGTPEVITDPEELTRACAELASGHGPVAVDTERASGYRYWQKAYLVQLRRAGAGTHLVDPIALGGELHPLASVLNKAEWVLHAATQDLPCLAELGLRPAGLFDTELAGRLAGYDRVGLGTLVERLLGYQLDKGHGAADWSTRPLPKSWLNYAALDVELLLPLRDALAAELDAADKLEWARQEFDAIRLADPPAPRSEPWRRTSGIHRVRSPRGLAIVRALWLARDELARHRDRAPAKVLPDRAIVAAAMVVPQTQDELTALDGFRGHKQRRHAGLWLRHMTAACELPHEELPDLSPPNGGPPPPNKWAEREPEAAARLTAARSALSELAQQYQVPVENLLLPELVRRLCWEPPAGIDTDVVAEVLHDNGARGWQVELTAEVLSSALVERSG